jgi:hypothetical protein
MDVVSVNGVRVDSSKALVAALRRVPEGAPVELGVA